MYLGGESVAGGYVNQGLGQDAPPRQQRLAQGLAASFASVFKVVERNEDRAVFEDLATGRSFTVHEHNPETDYGPGMLGLGRLIPLGSAYLRSPGMAFVSFGDNRPLTRDLARTLEEIDDAGAKMVLIEGSISQMLCEVDVPRRVPPASNADAARERVSVATALLEAEGYASPVSPGDVSPEIAQRLHEHADSRTMQYELDETMGEWLGALLEQAGRGASGGARRRRGARARKAKRNRRR